MSNTDIKTTIRGILRSTEGYKHVSIDDNTGLQTETTIVDSNGNLIAAPTTTEPLKYSNETGITAHASTAQATATQLTEEFNNVTTVVSDGHGVKLQTAVAGRSIKVKNSGAASLAVWPFLADSINALAVNLSVNIPVGGMLTFNAISDTVWETQEVLVSTSPTTQTGEFIIKAVANDTDTATTLSNAAMGQASVISIPDPGASTANILLTSQANDNSLVTATAVELNLLDGVTATTAEINTATDQSAQQLTAGTGITDGAGTLHHSSIEKHGGIFYTYLYMDLTGLASSTTDDDIIGAKGADIVVNGAWGADSDWTYGTEWSFETDHALCEAGSVGVMEPAVPLAVLAGATYEVTYTMGFTAGTCVVSIGGTNGTSRGSSATFVEYLVAADTTNLKFTSDTAGNYTIDDVIVKLVSPAYIGQITAAKNGTVFRSTVTWLKTPAGGADDINFWSATEATGVFDSLVTDLSETSLYDKTSAAAAAINTRIDLTANPAADEYLYLAGGEAGTAATYTAGIFVLEFWGA